MVPDKDDGQNMGPKSKHVVEAGVPKQAAMVED